MAAPLHGIESEEPPQARSMQRAGYAALREYLARRLREARRRARGGHAVLPDEWMKHHSWGRIAELVALAKSPLARKRVPHDQAHRSAPGGEVERKGNDGKTN